MRGVITLVLLGSSVSFAQTVSTIGDIVVVSDPNGAITGLVTGQAIMPSPQEQFCRAAYNAMRTALPDEFDGIISFSATDGVFTDIHNVWQGSPVRAAGSGIGRMDAPWASSYNGKISQCVFMGTLGKTAGFFPGAPGIEALPPDPDSNWKPSLGVPIPGIESLTGIEMLGHEYGHHWLLNVEFDQADGRGKQHFIRGFEGGNENSSGSPNQHYSAYSDSRSVMYGDCLTDLGGGSVKFEGCVRKYSPIDQYLMGLRGPTEVPPMMVFEVANDPGHGSAALAMARGSSRTENGFVRSDITIQEIQAAVGSRVPAYPHAKNCWRVAFVVVLAPGQTQLPAAMLAKVQKYQQRWGPWFSFATDGRGTMDSRLSGNGCLVPTVDAGTPDAGAEEPDAGVLDAGLDADAGVAEPDAGAPLEEQPPAEEPYAPSKADTWVDLGNTKLKPGCGCASLTGFEPLALGLALAALRLRRRRA